MHTSSCKLLPKVLANYKVASSCKFVIFNYIKKKSTVNLSSNT